MNKTLKVLFLAAFILSCPEGAKASFVSKEDALTVATTWLEKNPNPMNSQMGNAIVEMKHYQGEESGNPGYYVAFLHPNGWVIVPADDSFEPILAFGGDNLTSERYESFPLRYMLRIDAPLQVFSNKAIRKDNGQNTELKNRWGILRQTISASLQNGVGFKAAADGRELNSISDDMGISLIKVEEMSHGNVIPRKLLETRA
jgi:hypothetical protein